MVRDQIKNLIKKAVEAEFGKIKIPEIEVARPENKEFGDYSSNIAMRLVGLVKKKPIEIAARLKLVISDWQLGFLEKIEAVEPGFVNFYLAEKYLQERIGEILKKAEKFGDSDIGRKRKINLEFISANPTGPLTLGNGRGGFLGDVLANVLVKAGYLVTQEYYVNDTGEQIRKLGEGVYNKIKEVKEIIEGIEKKEPQRLGERAAKEILEKLIKPEIEQRMKVNFDVWFSEKSLYDKKEVDEILEFLRKKDLTFEKEGAIWFKSTKFGDDKDRVLVKAGGKKAYLAPDIAYLRNKFERGFDKLIYIWGADHHGYIKRLKAAAQAFGYDPERVKIIIMQLVRLIEDGKEVRMSKRTGSFVTLRELIDEIGLDAARFFFLMHSADSHMNFDLFLAKEKSQKNPVYYVQYAYARISSILRKAQNNFQFSISNFHLLEHSSELSLIKQLIRLPEVVDDIAKDYQVQRLPNYALELVTAFHKFYEECRVISDDKEKTQARLGLIMAAKIVLKNILDILGVSAPEKM